MIQCCPKEEVNQIQCIEGPKVTKSDTLEIADDRVGFLGVADDGGAEGVLRVPDLPLRTEGAANISGG